MTKSQLEKIIQALVALRDSATDEQAVDATVLYPTLKYDGSLVKNGTRINWNGTLKRAAVDLWDRAENDPDNAPTLWEDINISGGYREIPETITVGLAFSKDECGWWNGKLYRSKIDSNVWNPDQYPSGWELVEG